MLELLPVFLITIASGFFSQLFSEFDINTMKYTRKSQVFYIIMAIALIIFAGTRYNYNDTMVYIGIYDDSVEPFSTQALKRVNFAIGENPGFVIFQQILKRCGFTSQSFIMITSIFTISVFLWFIKKHTTDLFMSSYLFMTFGCYSFFLAGIKQSMAMAFSAIAVDCLLNNKKFQFVIWIIIAALFHPYALMYLICPFLFFKPWTKRTWYLLGVFGIAGLSFQFLLPRIVSITQLIGEDYTVETFTTDMGGVNPLRVLVCLVPMFLSFVVRKNIDDSVYNKENYLIINLAMLNGELMFVGMFGASIFTGRLANYFILFQLIALPYLLKFLNSKYRTLIYFVAILLFFLFFYYSNVLAYGSSQTFDILFYRYTLKEYFEQGIFIK